MMTLSPLRFWQLCLLGFCVFAVFLVVRLPAGLVLSGLSGVRGTFEGTVWNARADYVSVDGYRLENVTLKTGFLPLVTGRVAGTLAVDGPRLSGKTGFSLRDGAYEFDDLDVRFRGRVSLFGRTVQPVTVMTSPVLMLDAAGGCRAGTFALQTSLLKDMAAGVADMPVLEGAGICSAGTIRLDMAGDSGTMKVSITADIDKTGTLTADVSVLPDRALVPETEALFGLAGLRRSGDTYKGQVIFSLRP